MTLLLKLLIYLIYQLESLRIGNGLRSFIYYILAYIIRYRRKVVDANLAILFPLASALELSAYKKRFYRHMADLIVETLWCFRASPEELKPKIRFINPEVFDEIHNSGNNATILLSHIGNWELFCQWAGLFIPKVNVIILYTPIKNKALNQLMMHLRQRFGALLVSTKSTLDLFRVQKTKQVCINLFAIDQNPGDPYHQHWLSFFGQNVPVIAGAEKFAKSQKQIAYFLRVTKSDVYELELIEVKYDHGIPYDLTEKQFELLESNILENPSLWLLSHNRFKYSKD
jgi:KDO2-lipid IV(A) lauroyltransferase